jgi:carbonic anhydrase
MMKNREGLHLTEDSAYLASEQALMKRITEGDCRDVFVVSCSDIEIPALTPKHSHFNGPVVLANPGCTVPRCDPWNMGGGSEAATVEYAVTGLAVKHIVVCGHWCEATKALWRHETADMQFVVPWQLSRDEAGSPQIGRHFLSRTAAEEHVLKQLENLQTHASVSVKLATRELALHGWLYEVETGRMFTYSSKQDRFVYFCGEQAERYSASVPACIT